MSTQIKLKPVIRTPKFNSTDPVDIQRIPVSEEERNINKFLRIQSVVYFKYSIEETNQPRKLFHLDRIISLPKAQCDDLIAMYPQHQQKVMARVLWQLYSSGNLMIPDIQYTKYLHWTNHWRSSGLGKVSIDHILPRSKYPQLTFDTTNWQPLKLVDNMKKGSQV